MRKELEFSYGEWNVFGFSRWQPSSEQDTCGLPGSVISSNVGRIAMIGYLDFDRTPDRWLMGFLPLEQAERIIRDKSGVTYWWIILSVASIDIRHDLRALELRYEHTKHPTLPNVYSISYANLRHLLEWAEGANQTLGSKELYAEIERLQLVGLQRASKVGSNAYEKHLEDKERKVLSLEDEIKFLRRELETAQCEIANLQSKLNPKDTKGYVYLLKMVNGDYWKIGRTAKPQKRMDKFDVKLPFPVECEHLIETLDMYALESELHSRYADKRAGGEWFALSQVDIDYIKSL